jgi:L-ascorbate metabolism protein UlaG (beta-lactamase superfamily)
MTHKKFGKIPEGIRLEKITKSKNYKDGEFQNINNTPAFAENYSVGKLIYERLFKKFSRLKPVDSIPHLKTNLHHLNPNENVLIWFGHSSYFMQIDGLKILVDPVISGNASPIPNTVKAFKGSDIYTVSDLPTIDYLLISHDHYDHLDYETLIALNAKVKKVICGLGVGSHFEHWGYQSDKIIEKDWEESVEINSNFKIHVEPARHFSGRTFQRNKTLWVSYVLEATNLKIFIGGDSGYDTHYANIYKKHGDFDLAILENGQYNKAWPYIHETPEEVFLAAQDLKAKRIFPVHSGKFRLSNHPWDEPLKRVTKLNETYNFPLVTPKIGELVNLNDRNQKFEQWWVGME